MVKLKPVHSSISKTERQKKKESRFSTDNKSLYVKQKNLTFAFQYYLLQQEYRNKYGKWAIK